ncbi:helix-turn-helix domain-containing protein [Qipengyuania sp. 902]|uniref:helix-turn-helix domain-containing protein n=1 Tax=Qipengyuania sp. 902 TaxID=3417565 RepID=UPI003EC0E197
MENDYPFADTLACRMLAEGIARAREDNGLSVRQIGKQMGYKTAVVLSHMATGRVPIPIDRAEELAGILGMAKSAFLRAVLIQRHPDVDWESLSSSHQPGSPDNLAFELEAILGARLKDLTREQRAVLREVVGERSPQKRWLSVHELYVVEVLRNAFPQLQTEGMDPDGLEKLISALSET